MAITTLGAETLVPYAGILRRSKSVARRCFPESYDQEKRMNRFGRLFQLLMCSMALVLSAFLSGCGSAGNSESGLGSVVGRGNGETGTGSGAGSEAGSGSTSGPGSSADPLNSSGFYLSFPLPSCPPNILTNCSPYNAPITSVFDHHGGRYQADQQVWAYTGEVGDLRDDREAPGLGTGGVSLYSFQKVDGSAFLVNEANYIGTIGASTLNYDGHPGYDYNVPVGTAVHAAADGTVLHAGPDAADPGAGIYIRVQHDSAGYWTQYLHLSRVHPSVTQNPAVTRGQLIGYSGNTGATTGPHLHFEVKKNAQGVWTSVDPYGWTGSLPDPYVLANVSLW